MTECQCSIATAHKKEHCCDAFNERLIFGQLHDIECTEPKQSSGAPYCGAHIYRFQLKMDRTAHS